MYSIFLFTIINRSTNLIITKQTTINSPAGLLKISTQNIALVFRIQYLQMERIINNRKSHIVKIDRRKDTILSFSDNSDQIQ